jgi:hypothetical protein
MNPRRSVCSLDPDRSNRGLLGTFRDDLENYLRWCGGAEIFAADARTRPMAPRTVQLRREQVRAAVTSLAAAGVDIGRLTSLAELASPRNFKAILTHRYESKKGVANSFDITWPAR